MPWIADWHYLEAHPDFNKTFDVALHLGTLVAVVAYFWADVELLRRRRFRSVSHRSIRTTDERIAWWIFAATVPAAIAGALGESTIENHLGQPWQIAIFMSVFAVCSTSPTARCRRVGWRTSASGRRSGSAPRRSSR